MIHGWQHFLSSKFRRRRLTTWRNRSGEKGHRRKFRAHSRRGLFVVNVSTLLIVPRRCFISMLVAAYRVVCRLNKEIKPFIRGCLPCHGPRNMGGRSTLEYLWPRFVLFLPHCLILSATVEISSLWKYVIERVIHRGKLVFLLFGTTLVLDLE